MMTPSAHAGEPVQVRPCLLGLGLAHLQLRADTPYSGHLAKPWCEDVTMLAALDQTWMDASSSWWAKANRAKGHIDSLHRQVDEFRASAPYSLTPEPTEKPGRLAYRLRFLKPVPVAISTTIGDVLSNLRAALESLAFEVAGRSQAGSVTARRERVSTFPICETPQALDDFFNKDRKDRKGLYDKRAQAAFRSVQPFTNLEEAQRVGIALDKSFSEEFRWDSLQRLDTLWNIDKHRRLTLMTWWPDLISWESDGPTNRRAFPGDGTLANESVLLYIEGADEGQGDDLRHQFNLVLTDDPAYSGKDDGTTDEVVRLLEHWHQHIVGLVFRRIFTIMSQAVATAQSPRPSRPAPSTGA